MTSMTCKSKLLSKSTYNPLRLSVLRLIHDAPATLTSFASQACLYAPSAFPQHIHPFSHLNHIHPSPAMCGTADIAVKTHLDSFSAFSCEAFLTSLSKLVLPLLPSPSLHPYSLLLLLPQTYLNSILFTCILCPLYQTVSSKKSKTQKTVSGGHPTHIC